MSAGAPGFQDVEKRFGAHLGAILHGSIYYIRRAGWWTTMPGGASADQWSAVRYLNVARDPITLSEQPSTIMLRLLAADNPTLVDVRVQGPRYEGWKYVKENHPERTPEAVFEVLHAYLEGSFLPRLFPAIALTSAPKSPKHWIPGRA